VKERVDSNVVDRDLNTFWSSAETPMPHWIQVRFTHPVTLGEVVVQSRRLDGIVVGDLSVAASVSGGSLATVGTVSGNTAADIPVSSPRR
jgi:hypothetical protein